MTSRDLFDNPNLSDSIETVDSQIARGKSPFSSPNLQAALPKVRALNLIFETIFVGLGDTEGLYSEPGISIPILRSSLQPILDFASPKLFKNWKFRNEFILSFILTYRRLDAESPIPDPFDIDQARRRLLDTLRWTMMSMEW